MGGSAPKGAAGAIEKNGPPERMKLGAAMSLLDLIKLSRRLAPPTTILKVAP
jgi:hypothetical protein